MAQFTGPSIPGASSTAGVLDGPATPIVLMTSGTVYDGPATPIQIVTGRTVLSGPSTPVQMAGARVVQSGKGIPVVIAGSDPTTTWNWDFRIGAMPTGATFTRGTAVATGGATVMDYDGILKYGPENLIISSNDFTQAVWIKQAFGTGVAPVVTPNFAPGPDGVAGAASRVVCQLGAAGSGDDQSFLLQNASLTGQRIFNIWAKLNSGTSPFLVIRCANGSTSIKLTNQWQQFSITDPTVNFNGNGVNFGLRSGNSGNNVSVDMLVAYAQCYRLPNVNTAYIPNVSTTAPFFGPRFAYDPISHAPLGYLGEPVSSNTVVQSQNFSTGWNSVAVTLANNAVTAPDGTLTGGTLLFNSGTALHQLTSSTSFAYTSGNVYGISCFVREITGGQWVQFTFGGNSGFNFQPSTGTIGSALTGTQSSLQKEALGGGWYRISFLFTAAATTSSAMAFNFVNGPNATPAPSIPGDGTSKVAVWGFQMDAANVGVTSYLQTAGATVTRTADVASLPLASIGWDGSQGGALQTTVQTDTPFGTMVAGMIEDNGTSNIVGIEAIFASANQRGEFWSGGVAQLRPTGAAAKPPFTETNIAFSWSPTHVALVNDGTVQSSTNGSYTLPVNPTKISFANSGGSLQLNGKLRSIAYYKGAQTDAFLQQITSVI